MCQRQLAGTAHKITAASTGALSAGHSSILKFHQCRMCPARVVQWLDNLGAMCSRAVAKKTQFWANFDFLEAFVSF